ncbi:N-alpha-acetyltransferase 80-like [Uloborus diversus]|uniref:N-alpha-acetyltransferase 80-like n=1 Tax=Uloborus diversus TaxID=327109 RepID=UPI00240A7629|nr:N-alpha-acetyltransferase 80-like [Uloborus diversus]XP_054724663.1 N-alpha-acetyltransferase 80-like [Uloborus diversus]XP_054724664.1 N-alpha-acetyltransferase 80-like [Uloborus diversus]
MKLDQLEILFLHDCKEYLEECANLLNKQWKRSFSARVQSLEKSFKDLPDSLLLIEKTENGRKVIGHSRLTRVLEDPAGCWIGSVLIEEEKRNQGFGKYLMIKTEEYAKSLKFHTAYLNTQDQQGFYEHLGYSYGTEVSSISFKVNRLNLFNKPLKGNSNSWSSNEQKNKQNCSKSMNNEFLSLSTKLEDTSLTPPLPPPLPLKPIIQTHPIKSNLGQYWMKKSL